MGHGEGHKLGSGHFRGVQEAFPRASSLQEHKELLLAGGWAHSRCQHPPCMLQDQDLPPSVPLPDVVQLIFSPLSLSPLKPAVQSAWLGWTHRAACSSSDSSGEGLSPKRPK